MVGALCLPFSPVASGCRLHPILLLLLSVQSPFCASLFPAVPYYVPSLRDSAIRLRRRLPYVVFATSDTFFICHQLGHDQITVLSSFCKEPICLSPDTVEVEVGRLTGSVQSKFQRISACLFRPSAASLLFSLLTPPAVNNLALAAQTRISTSLANTSHAFATALIAVTLPKIL